MTGPIQLEDVQHLDLRPGDVVVVRVQFSTQAQMSQMADHLLRAYPDVRWLVVPADVTLEILRQHVEDGDT